MEGAKAWVLHAAFAQLYEVTNDIDDVRRAFDFLFSDSVHKLEISE
jgi:hypothetical protein